tara:strand:+ start:15801 stop:15965 length:165 start_codon:yes stop_codon:yes gene_type:complete
MFLENIKFFSSNQAFNNLGTLTLCLDMTESTGLGHWEVNEGITSTQLKEFFMTL